MMGTKSTPQLRESCRFTALPTYLALGLSLDRDARSCACHQPSTCVRVYG